MTRKGAFAQLAKWDSFRGDSSMRGRVSLSLHVRNVLLSSQRSAVARFAHCLITIECPRSSSTDCSRLSASISVSERLDSPQARASNTASVTLHFSTLLLTLVP